MKISISRNGAEIGEWPQDEVMSLYQAGDLLGTDFYWHEGMAEWKELRSFIKPPPPRPVPPAVVQKQSQTEAPIVPTPFIPQEDTPSFPDGYTQATYKIRCAARTIDMAIIWIIALALDLPMYWTANSAFGSALPPSDPNWLAQFLCEAAGAYAIFCCTFFAWETFWITIGGSSIGKMFFGLRAVSLTKTRIRAYRAFVRSLYLYMSLWFFLVFPIGPATSAIYLEKKFLKDGTTAWDKKTRMTVLAKRIGWIRAIIAWCITIVSAIFMLWLTALSRQSSH